MYSKIQRELTLYNLSSGEEKIRLELAAYDDWLFWSRKTWVRFTFVYCDNEENRRLGRVGQASGIRYGTRNLDLMPTSKKPKVRNKNTRTVRYLDTGRPNRENQGRNQSIRDASGRYTKNVGQAINGSWRSFRPNTFVIITGIWSFEKGKFVSDYGDFNTVSQPTG